MLFKHLQGLVKVADLTDSAVAMAMEVVSDDSAVVFLFTKARDLQYTVGVSSVKFDNLDSQQVQHPTQQRLKRNNQD